MTTHIHRHPEAQSQSTSGHTDSNLSLDSWMTDAQSEYGNAALLQLVMASNTVAADNTSVDFFQNADPQTLQNKHRHMVENLTITMSEYQLNAARQFQAHWERNQGRYEAVAQEADVPAKLIAALHWRESTGNFGTYLHQGDPLGRPAVNWPNNIPVFHRWEDAAIHALNMKKWNRDTLQIDVNTQDPGKLGAYAEMYNGLGYHNRSISTPYVYAGSSAYASGKYIADGRFSSATVDSQVGVVPLMGAIEGLQSNRTLDPRLMTQEDAWQQVCDGHMVLRQGVEGMQVEALQRARGGNA